MSHKLHHKNFIIPFVIILGIVCFTVFLLSPKTSKLSSSNNLNPRMMLESYLADFKYPNPRTDDAILDYEIEKIGPARQNGDTLEFDIVYSVRVMPQEDEPSSWQGIDTMDSHGWIRHKPGTAKAQKIGNTYIINEITHVEI